MQQVTLGPLQAILTPNVAPGDVRQTVVLLHGYGAPGTDLVGLAPSLNVPEGTQFAFLQAPHTIEGMSGPGAGRAWWHIDMITLQVARMTGQNDELAAQVPEGIDEAREVLTQALAELEHSHGMKWEQTVVGGFSQGAMLSMDYTLRSEVPLRGLMQLSGTMICEATWLPLMEKRAGLRVLQSHSPDDQILPFVLAQRLQQRMLEARMRASFVTFRGGHGIGPEVLDAMSAFLSES
jgi:phospholipase/carboxylesterase